MFSQLLQIFRTPNPMTKMAKLFTEMLETTHEMNMMAGRIVFENDAPPEAQQEIYRSDVRVNKAERKLRKLVITHMAVGPDPSTIPHTLLLMSLVKDVERLGDYAKNLTELRDFFDDPFPNSIEGTELQLVRKITDDAFDAVRAVLDGADQGAATDRIRQLKDAGRRCDNVIPAIARSAASTEEAVVLTATSRHYKRIGGHLLNLFTSVVMPLHKVDYYDERGIPAPIRRS
ncbi:MAG: PhoU domain-containing protein [Acidobacteria bacterium]|nr:MAG: PhoU domain-containing protein [Acidobacteriota bacterium]